MKPLKAIKYVIEKLLLNFCYMILTYYNTWIILSWFIAQTKYIVDNISLKLFFYTFEPVYVSKIAIIEPIFLKGNDSTKVFWGLSWRNSYINLICCTYKGICVHMHLLWTYIYVYVCIHMYIYIEREGRSTWKWTVLTLLSWLNPEHTTWVKICICINLLINNEFRAHLSM